MNIADRAQDITELERESIVARRMPEGPLGSGACLNCGVPLEESGRRWCDAECRDDWEEAYGRRR